MLHPASSGGFLITPNVGLMVWTLVLFVLSMVVLAKLAFPRISEALDRRQRAIEDSIDTAERMRQQADQLLAEYKERLAEAAERREQMMEQTRRDIEAETRRAIDEIRREVADLTIMATEKITRKTLTEDDQRRLVDDALSELDFSALSRGAA